MCSLIFQREVSDWRGWALAWRGLQADCLGILIFLKDAADEDKVTVNFWRGERWTRRRAYGRSKRRRNGRRAPRRVIVEISGQEQVVFYSFSYPHGVGLWEVPCLCVCARVWERERETENIGRMCLWVTRKPPSRNSAIREISTEHMLYYCYYCCCDTPFTGHLRTVPDCCTSHHRAGQRCLLDRNVIFWHFHFLPSPTPHHAHAHAHTHISVHLPDCRHRT